MELSKKDVFTMVAIFVSLAVPIAGGVYAFVNSQVRIVNRLDRAVAVWGAVLDQYAVDTKAISSKQDDLEDEVHLIKIEQTRIATIITEIQGGIADE